MNIVGRWNRIVDDDDAPEDEVLTFLPDGTGVYEYYWWRLSFYATFRYTFDGTTLRCDGLYDYDYDFEIEMQRESAADWTFTTTVTFDAAQHPFEVLELAHPMPISDQRYFKRTIAAENMHNFQMPTFWEEAK